jgi:hypothetical protein
MLRLMAGGSGWLSGRGRTDLSSIIFGGFRSGDIFGTGIVIFGSGLRCFQRLEGWIGKRRLKDVKDKVMGVKYEVASPKVQTMCREIVEAHHPELVEYEVSVTCLFAEQESGENKPSVKLHGRPCFATIKKTSARDRALGLPDAVITIDRRKFKELGDRSRRAMLDHELSHLEVDGGADSAGRPKLNMRHHDWELHGFRGVVDRWGVDAVELSQLNEFSQCPDGQAVFQFLEEIDDQLPDAMEYNGTTVDLNEEIYKQAVEVLAQTGRASTSALQRRLRIGYTRAARLIDLLEERGVIGPPNGSEPREIIGLPCDLPNTGTDGGEA